MSLLNRIVARLMKLRSRPPPSERRPDLRREFDVIKMAKDASDNPTVVIFYPPRIVAAADAN